MSGIFKKNTGTVRLGYRTESLVQASGERIRIRGRDPLAVHRLQNCDICGRTLLTGERPEDYVNPESGEKMTVCSVCGPDARRCGFSHTD